jgi:cytochrome P450
MSDLATFNPFDPTVLQCPFPHYARMRDEAPVLKIEPLGVYLVTRYDLVSEIARDQKTFSNDFGGASMPLPPGDREKLIEAMNEGYPRVSTMLTADQPAHTRYRRLVARAFNPRAIADLEPVVRSTSIALIESWLDRERIEFVENFAVPLPVRVIAHALNVPDDRLADFKKWSDDSIAGIGTNISIEQRVAAERGVYEFQRYFAEQIELRRTEPRDDLLTNLLNARVDDDDPEVLDKRPLDMPEMLSIVQQLLVAGNETTTKMLTEMMRLLAEHPDEWRKLKDDPTRVDRVVEETLRLSTPTQGMWRIVTRDVELGGVHIPAGSRLVVVYSAANRDPAVFADPDEFDPDRPELREHVAFGKGIHYCLGANLARLEGKVALEEIVRRLESFTLAESNRFDYFPSFMLRGLTRLEIEFTPATQTAGVG